MANARKITDYRLSIPDSRFPIPDSPKILGYIPVIERISVFM
ncbi:hypothetical protein [Moorena sp. SIO4A1]|nr:hypothetical protein [Moorena sp. SIO4A1]